MSFPPALAAAAALIAPLTGAWPDSFGARLEALAQVQAFNAELLSHDSATQTLQHWCEAHGAAPGLKIVARRIDLDKLAGPAERADLGVGPEEPLRYRRVELACGDRVLSRADNWYRPGRLTPEMNAALETTQTPFGVVVRALGYHRRTLSSELLFQPLPRDWETLPRAPEPVGATLVIPPEILRHRAVLSTPDGVAFSLVQETYTDQVLFRPAYLP
ncbi:hypothetical protein [Phenylobacterium aquaticum]|uniref:hypothetical protein n=1 Tax=Phenylobacterium aquaticum TaxID=1763816 RepID=UPI001F5C7A92|nr:hypothetical protein [Phenylobacterium aquaticum]MCI3134372.1 hypothetical protein [Phenylobacterium aquaticum]